MPLLDHFHPPLSVERRWESFHSSWATRLADALTEHWLPPNYIAEEHVHFGPSVEIDVATFAREASGIGEDEGGTVVALDTKVWSPPVAEAVIPSVFPDTFEVRVLSTDAGPKLVAAIELISPGNKDRPTERRAFATKVAGYLYQGISVIIVDIVTNRRANLHNELLRVMEADDNLQLPPATTLYAVAYRPLRRARAIRSTSGGRRWNWVAACPPCLWDCGPTWLSQWISRQLTPRRAYANGLQAPDRSCLRGQGRRSWGQVCYWLAQRSFDQFYISIDLGQGNTNGHGLERELRSWTFE